MKILQVVPKAGIDSKLKTLLKTTERQLRGPHTTFEREKEGRWKHVKYPGWIQWDDAPGGILIAEIRTKVKDHGKASSKPLSAGKTRLFLARRNGLDEALPRR